MYSRVAVLVQLCNHAQTREPSCRCCLVMPSPPAQVFRVAAVYEVKECVVRATEYSTVALFTIFLVVLTEVHNVDLFMPQLRLTTPRYTTLPA